MMYWFCYTFIILIKVDIIYFRKRLNLRTENQNERNDFYYSSSKIIYETTIKTKNNTLKHTLSAMEYYFQNIV